MGKYGYGSWNSWGSNWGSGKEKGSVSGWEKSHFGGYNRVLSDYPYIKIDFELDIKAGKKIGFTGRASLKAKGMLPRANGRYVLGPKYSGTGKNHVLTRRKR